MTLVNVLPKLRGEAVQGVQSASALLLGILHEFPVCVCVCVGGASKSARQKAIANTQLFLPLLLAGHIPTVQSSVICTTFVSPAWWTQA